MTHSFLKASELPHLYTSITITQHQDSRLSVQTRRKHLQNISPALQRTSRMGSSGIHIVCVGLGILGLIGGIMACVLPNWKVSSFTGQNIITAQIQQEGLWMDCVVQSTGQQQCKAYESLLILSSDLQAARAMTIICCMLTVIGLLALFAGADFTTCIENEDIKPKVCLVAGVALLLSGLLLIIPVSWSANNTVRNFNNPLILASNRRELGSCIFIGWAGGVLLLLAGGLLCCFSRPCSGSSGGTAKYYSNNASAPSKNYV
ncbi:claudin i [Pygocentrus nattereri]|uniref:Claudin i n=1 Tax=Pygocentrus nattereri TaxID=42514 RepID=A0A3B4E600_PYGNA|nr:claudin i [Pygocentrus nattereri]